MELKKKYLIVLCILFISCNGGIKKESSNSIQFKEVINESYKEIKYIKKEKEGSKDIFVYEDIEISIDYFPNKLISFHKRNRLNTYKYDYDLDLGEIELIRFANGNESLYLVELDNYYSKIYNLYFFVDDSVYYLGEIDTDLSKIIEDNPKVQIEFQISKNDNKIEIQQLVNDKKFYFKSFEINNISQLISLNDKASNSIWLGKYEISPMIVSQHRGKELEVTYLINIDSDNHAILNIESTHHEDRFCQGEHDLIKENNTLHAIGKCKETGVEDFYIKKENDEYFIKSRRFVNEDWQELKKIK
ncbi:hypothetical protein [Empedobacter tilapiae]